MTERRVRPAVIVLGTMCKMPQAGMVWLFLNYLLGLEQLGYEAYYVEWHGRWVADPERPDADSQVRRVMVGEVLARYGFGDRWICRADHRLPGATYGRLDPASLPSLFARAEAVLNVTGAHVLEQWQMSCPRRVYLETDPGVPQALLAAGDSKMRALVDAHTHLATWAQNIDGVDCLLPGTDLAYIPTRQPVALQEWRPRPVRPDAAFTTVARWARQGKDMVVGGRSYHWSKDLQFRALMDLPRRSPGTALELALSAASGDDVAELRANGWHVTDAELVSATLGDYQRYLEGSAGEFTIAKDQYVGLRTGWFSDRSACYLAAGRPVITQDSRFDTALPVGEGLHAWDDVDTLPELLAEVHGRLDAEARAAAEIAREYFAAERVLGELLEKMGLGRP